MSRRPENPRYRNSGWVSALFLSTAALGWLFPWHEDPPTVKDCTPVNAEAHPHAEQALLSQGYLERADGALIPRGCER